LALGIFLLLLGALLAGSGFISGSPDFVALAFFGILVAGIGAAGVIRSRFFPDREQLTPEGLRAQATDQAAADVRQAEIFNRWYVRYPAAIAALGVLWWLIAEAGRTGKPKEWVLWVVGLTIVGYALWWTREISKWLIGLALVFWGIAAVSDGLHRMSTPSAIIVGACIIAWAVFSSRKR
jgi:hypothetical protein